MKLEFHCDVAGHLMVNTKWNVVVCVTCGVCLGGSQILDHCQRKHRFALTAEAKIRIAEWIAGHPGQLEMDKSQGFVSMIHGVPVYDGLKCNRCDYYCRSKHNMRKHLLSVHQLRLAEPGTAEECKVQQLQRGQGATFFGVALDQQMEQPTDDGVDEDVVMDNAEVAYQDGVDAAIDILFPPNAGALTTAQRLGGQQTVNQTQKDAFQARMAWDELLVDYGEKEDLIAATKLPEEGERHHRIISVLEDYFSKLQILVPRTSRFLLAYIGGKYSKVESDLPQVVLNCTRKINSQQIF